VYKVRTTRNSAASDVYERPTASQHILEFGIAKMPNSGIC